MKLKTETRLKRALRAKKFDAGLRQDTVEFARAAVATGKTLTVSVQPSPSVLFALA